MRLAFDLAPVSLLLFLAGYPLQQPSVQVQGARTNKHVPFLQEELQLRQRQRHRPRTFASQDTSSRHRQADKLVSQLMPRGRHGGRTLLDYVQYEAGGDGLNVTWDHNVNSKQALGRALSDASNGLSIIVEGDVFLKRQSGYMPMMLIPPSANDALKFKDWLADVSRSDRTVKINLKTTEVIKPALQYLFTVKDGFKGPLILHSNIGIMPGSLEVPVDAGIFTTEMQNAMPEATIGVGWADSIMPMPDDDSVPVPTKYTWRIIFNMLEYTYEMRQPILFSFRALHATDSVYELLWLLSIRDSYAVNIFAADKEVINDWAGLVALRQYGPRDRIIYDFSPMQRQAFLESVASIEEVDLLVEPSHFDKSAWRVVQFINPTALLSTIVVGSRGAAFLGWPTAFLLSHVHARPGRTQTITGRLLFVKKDSLERTYAAEECGLAILLLSSIDDVPSPIIRGGIRVFIGSTGRVSLQNRHERRSLHRHRHKQHNESDPRVELDGAAPYAYISPSRSDGPLTASRLPAHECYGFRLLDEQRRIRLTVFVSRCSGGVQPFPKSASSRTIVLNVPRPAAGRSRYVVVQKTGDASVDAFVENLYHRNCAAAKDVWRRLLIPTVALTFLKVLESIQR